MMPAVFVYTSSLKTQGCTTSTNLVANLLDLNTAVQNKISHIPLWLISVKTQNLNRVPAV